MKQHYYVHIGNGKTGTTSIQAFLNENREQLAANGICYPKSIDINHHFLICNKDGGPLTPDQQRKSWQRVIAEGETSGASKVVISSERLASLATDTDVRMIGELLKGDKVSIIFYGRRQDAHIQSNYLQYLKTGGLLITPEEYLEAYQRDFLDIANRWATVFGDENIIVFPFEKSRLQPSLVHTFFHCLDEPVVPGYTTPRLKNVSPHPDVVAAMVEITRIGKLGIFEEEDLRQVNTSLHAAPTHLFSKMRQYSVFSPKQRKELIEQFADSNREIARRFLGREDGALFQDMPIPEDGTSGKTFSLTTESLFAMMIAMHMENHRHLARLNRKLPQNVIRRAWGKLKKKIGL